MLSEARITHIYLKYISVGEAAISSSKRAFSIEFQVSEQLIFFQYASKDKVKLHFGILKIADRMALLIGEMEDIRIGLDVEFVCDNVVTPITITLVLKRYETQGIGFMYHALESYIGHGKEKFIK